MAKRIFDVCVATLLLVVFLPLLIVIGIIVKLTSAGPVIFRQERMGFLNKPFVILKFRTMLDGSGKKHDFVLKGDPRVTKVGTFLRSTHFDELPQLWNVLKGEMSLVGPRPDPVAKAWRKASKDPRYLEQFRVLPGMTGPTQIYGRMWQISNDENVVKENLAYVENKNLLGDLKILLATIFVVLRRQGV